ncbi:MAG TPA: MFS transporter [Pseudoduganella sp.]
MRHPATLFRYSAWGLAAIVCGLLIGELGIAMRERWALPTGLVVLRRHGASDTTISLLLSTLPAIISVFVVPRIGYYSDHFRSRWGRRRPFLLATSLLGAAAMVCVAFSPALAQLSHALLGSWSPGLTALSIGWFCVFWTIFDCAAITTTALYNGLVNDVIPRGFVGRFYAVFRIVGLSVAIGFNTSVFALTDAYLFEVLLAIALIFGLALPLMCLITRERPLDDAPAPALKPFRASWPRLQGGFLWKCAMFMLAAVTFSPFNTFSQSYAQDLGISLRELGSLTASAYAVSIASAFGVGWLVDRFGAVRVSAALMGAYCLIALGGFVLVRDADGFRYFFLAHVIVSGAYFTAASSMPIALFPRLDFVRFNASKDIMVAFATIAVSTVQGPVLDLSGHNYQLTLASAALFSLLCLVCMARLSENSSPAPLSKSPAGTELNPP